MRKKVITFFSLVFLFMALLPAINFWRAPTDIWESAKNEPKKLHVALYNTDIVKQYNNTWLFSFGISTDPMHTIIGYDNWLFLGDLFSQNFSRKRVIAEETKHQMTTLLTHTNDWYHWLKEKDIAYQVLIAPDKESVYQDVLPRWAQSKQLPIDLLAQQADPDIVKTVHHTLIKEKEHATVFYKYDTHWNVYGAAVGLFDFLAQPNNPFAQLTWPEFDKTKGFIHPNYLKFDLGLFLHLPIIPQEELVFSEVINPADTLQVYDGPPATHSPTTVKNHFTFANSYPQWLINDNALNDKKLIWLRDSFGIPISTYFNSTFKEIIQVNQTQITRDDFIHLIETEQPDYVLISSVEREIFNGALMFPAPNKK